MIIELSTTGVKWNHNPRIHTLFRWSMIGKGKIFSKLDMKSAYNLIWIKSGDEYKTAFTFKLGYFEYSVVPFGLKNTPAVFQHFVSDIFEDIICKFVYCYIDDIFIFSSDYSTHVEHIEEVLSRLRSSKLVTTLEKCEWVLWSLYWFSRLIHLWWRYQYASK